mmetsp:Transcript_22075/g.41606  ORF Transcript_22075/g.41606 Transcript_22075/m.41606 type:complete len:336 (+) Transcript_22075:89-1096(+)
MAPGKPRVQFRVMEGAEALGLRALRREFGQYGELVCALLRVDSARLPVSVEIEFASSKDTLRVKSWTGEGSHLPLYKPEGLVDAFRRDADAAFLCYADNFDKNINSFRDLAYFSQYVTDWCSASLKTCCLCWSPTRGVFAQMECCQKADQERVISKLMTELYGAKRLSVSSVSGGDYHGVSEKSYRVDWSVVASEAAVAGIENREADKIKKAQRAARKREKKKDKKNKKDKKSKKKKKEKNKDDKKSKKEKEDSTQLRAPYQEKVLQSTPSQRPSWQDEEEGPDNDRYAWEDSSSGSSSALRPEKPPEKKQKVVKATGKMALLAGSDDDSTSGSE